MPFHLPIRGEVRVVGHRGAPNVGGLSDDFLPGDTQRTRMPLRELERATALRSIRALGTATPWEITAYFARGRYQERGAVKGLEAEGAVRRGTVEAFAEREERQVQARDLPLLRPDGGPAFEPRMSLLPPFDHLISSPARTKPVSGFDYVREQFLAAEKRRFGTTVLPIVWGDRLISRVDPRFDRRSGTLVATAVHAEPDAPRDPEVAAEIGETIERLAEFVGAPKTRCTSRIPRNWKGRIG